nr:hypothetical protein CFP56_21505 [Quercus suber]
MFSIQDMASRPMEEVPIVQQPTEGLAKGPNEDALQFIKLLKDSTQPCYEGYVRHKDWAVVVKTKLREVFDVGINASHDDDDEVGTYHENVPYNITIDDACDDANDNHVWDRVNEEGTIYDTLLISEDELLQQDFINDEELSDDVYESNDDESNDDESDDDESSDDES